MAKLIFFDDKHEYQVDGDKKPSVSEILRFMSREIYQTTPQGVLDKAADRGTRIHKACENLDRYGSCDIEPDIEPYIKAYVQFRKDYEPEWLKIECSMYNPELDYAGTIDRYGIVRGKRLLVDIKSVSSPHKEYIGAQLNGYDLILDANGLPVDGIAFLHLKPDGKYKLAELPINSEVFEACLTLHNIFKKKRRK